MRERLRFLLSLLPLLGLLLGANSARTDLGPEELRQIEIFERASRSVVNITTVTLRRNLFTLSVFEVPSGTGSGFIWDGQGHVVTNYHVVEGSRSFEITLANHQTYIAELVGIAPAKDLAVLHITAPSDELVPIELGRSANLAVGQKVLAVGNPFGLDQSLTIGVVSALGRELQAPNGRTIRDIIQTDAAINPGNSGGPLLDSSGRLVGVNSAIYSPSGASAGVGFSIPVDTVRRLVPQMIKSGHPIQPGIGIVPLPDTISRRYGLDGIVVREVIPGTPADRAGMVGLQVLQSGRGRQIQLGDQILMIDQTAVNSTDDLLYAFEKKGIGSTVRLVVKRNSKRREFEIGLVSISSE